MTKEQIRNIAALIGTLVQTGFGHFSVQLDEQWRFSFQMGIEQSEFCLSFSWGVVGHRESKSRQALIDNETIDWDMIVLWLMRNSDKLAQWSK